MSATQVGQLQASDIMKMAGQQPTIAPDTISMRPTAQRAYGMHLLMSYAIHEAEKSHGTPSARGFDPVPFALPSAKARRQAAYNLFRRGHQRLLKHTQSLQNVLGKRLRLDGRQGASPAQVGFLIQNHIVVNKSQASAHMKHVFWLFLYNALNAPGRRRAFDASVAPTASCHFCLQERTLNTFKHYVGHCTTVAKARLEFFSWAYQSSAALIAPRLGKATMEEAYLACKVAPITALLTVVFTHAIWISLSKRWAHETGATIQARWTDILAIAQQNAYKVAPQAWALPPRGTKKKSKAGPPRPPNVTAYKARHAVRAVAILDPYLRRTLLYPATAVAFTDGSRQDAPNDAPPHAGAGATIWSPGEVQGKASHTVEMSKALGETSNNVAEIWGVGMVAEWLLRPEHKSTIPLMICSDSTLTIGIMEYLAVPRTNTGPAHKVRSMIERLRLIRPVRFLWTPGHTGIAGNELADKLADKGCKRSLQGAAEGKQPFDRRPAYTNEKFVDGAHTITQTDIRAHVRFLPTTPDNHQGNRPDDDDSETSGSDSNEGR
jgi:ribonuclease HI